MSEIMELIMIGFGFVLQGLIYIMFLAVFIPTQESFKKAKGPLIAAQVLLTLITVICFFVASTDGWIAGRLFPKEGFFEYGILMFISLVFFWLMRLEIFKHHKLLGWISYTLLGVLFWLSVLTAIKFIPMIMLVFFPILGVLVAAPFFVSQMVLYDIIRLQKEHGRFNFLHVISMGLGFLFPFQLLMNCWTTEPWALVKLFQFTDSFI